MLEAVKTALEVLKKGGIILYPTDTIWGIGCDATNPQAVSRIYAVKKREDAKSMLILVDSVAMLDRYVKEVPAIALDLVELADKPLTIIYPGAKNLAPNLPAEDNSIGIRVVQDAFCRNLIARFRKPIVSTSANISGQPTPVTFEAIAPELKDAVDYVVAWRQDDPFQGKPSGILKIGLRGEVNVIRE